jgi:hypothetical protein
MEGRIARTLDTLREALDAAYAVRKGALERGDLDFAAREEAQISRLEARITQLEGTAQRWAGGDGYRERHPRQAAQTGRGGISGLL